MKHSTRVARLLRKTAGKFFYAEFIKKDGTVRRIIARLNVKKDLKGAGLPYDPSQYRLMVVWDVGKRNYRMIDLDTVFVLRCGKIRLDLRTPEEKELAKQLGPLHHAGAR